MRAEQRQALDEIIIKMRSGRMKRRTFIERAITLGLASSTAGSLLAACGGSVESTAGNGPALNIVWQSERDTTGVFQKLVDHFNKTNNDGIFVTYISGSIDTGLLRTTFLDMLNTRSDANDIISMDIIWPAEFAVNQWTVPIQDRWPASERARFLPGPIQGCTFDDQIWAVPLHTDAGLLFYRNDLVATPPQSWEEMTNTARQLKTSGQIKYGYVWQGAQYEGLVCDFLEVLYGYGGAVLDPRNPRKVTISSPEAVQALTSMVGWINDISPTEVTNYKEDDSNGIWMNADSAFMRNWPYIYSLSNNPQGSKIVNKVGSHVMPKGGTNNQGHSVIGGWQMGINAFSNSDKVEAAWKFIRYMTSFSAQKTLATDAAYAATLTSVYQDKDVLAKNPVYKALGDALLTALPRPVTPQYSDVSSAIQLRIHQALTRQSSTADAIKALQNDIESIVAS